MPTSSESTRAGSVHRNLALLVALAIPPLAYLGFAGDSGAGPGVDVHVFSRADYLSALGADAAAFDLVEEGATVLDPSTDAETWSIQRAEQFLPFWRRVERVESSEPRVDHPRGLPGYFAELGVLLARADQASSLRAESLERLARWRRSFEPSLLIAAGVDYVLADGKWIASQPTEAAKLLADESSYRIIRRWNWSTPRGERVTHLLLMPVGRD